MKTYLKLLLLVLTVLLLTAVPCWSQNVAKVGGRILGTDGQPLTDAVVDLTNVDNGMHYALKTNNKGEFSSIAVQYGIYKLMVKRGDTLIYHDDQFQVKPDAPGGLNKFDLDLSKMKQGDSSSALTAEQQKQQAAAIEENKKIGNVNELLKKGTEFMDQKQYDTALSMFQQAATAFPNSDIPQAQIAEAYSALARQNTDAESRNAQLKSALDAYNKAIEIATASPKESVKLNLGPYYNNAGALYAKLGMIPEATNAYKKAAEAKPSEAGMYMFNLGATMVNTNHAADGIAAFKKAIELDPTYAEAYYQLGISLMSQASTDKDGKVIPVPGTAEALQKYVELKPNGPNAVTAKQMLDFLGSTVQNAYGTKKKGK